MVPDPESWPYLDLDPESWPYLDLDPESWPLLWFRILGYGIPYRYIFENFFLNC